MPKQIKYPCAICFLQPADIVSSCNCLYCSECHSNCKTYVNIEDTICLSCNNSIKYYQSIFIYEEESVRSLLRLKPPKEVQNTVIELLKFYKVYSSQFMTELINTLIIMNNTPSSPATHNTTALKSCILSNNKKDDEWVLQLNHTWNIAKYANKNNVNNYSSIKYKNLVLFRGDNSERTTNNTNEKESNNKKKRTYQESMKNEKNNMDTWSRYNTQNSNNNVSYNYSTNTISQLCRNGERNQLGSVSIEDDKKNYVYAPSGKKAKYY